MSAPAARERRDDWLRIVLPVAVLALSVVAWDLVVRLNNIPPYILPGPGLVRQHAVCPTGRCSAARSGSR